MSVFWSDDMVTLHLGDCRSVLGGMPDSSVDAIVTDPPAGISFMGRDWDSNLGSRDRWIGWLSECLAEACRVLKPGGHALVWALPRTAGWTQIALEDAGFEVRDCFDHLFGSGFPKSLDVSKAIDAAAGETRAVVAEGAPVRRMIPGNDQNRTTSWVKDNGREFTPTVTEPATAEARAWQGWGTALKPSHELWWLARKPFAGTVAANVLEHGTGALNIAACRIETTDDLNGGAYAKVGGRSESASLHPGSGMNVAGKTVGTDFEQPAGRWPPNVLLTHSAACEQLGTRTVRSDGHHPAARGAGGLSTSGHAGQQALTERKSGAENVEAWACAEDCPVAELDRQSGAVGAFAPVRGTEPSAVTDAIYGQFAGRLPGAFYGDQGGASRFFPTFRYEAKAGADERPRLADGTMHPTVKAVELMRWLVKLITPRGGTVLDLFAGSGATAEACVIDGFKSVLIEIEPKSCELIRKRLSKDIQPDMFGGAA